MLRRARSGQTGEERRGELHRAATVRGGLWIWLWLVSALTAIGETSGAQGAEREAAGLRQPAAVCPGDRTAQRLAPWEHPQVFSHLALINACLHLIREDERIAGWSP